MDKSGQVTRFEGTIIVLLIISLISSWAAFAFAPRVPKDIATKDDISDLGDRISSLEEALGGEPEYKHELREWPESEEKFRIPDSLPIYEEADIDWRQFEGTTIEVLWTTHDVQEGTDKCLSQFEELTGINVISTHLDWDHYFERVETESMAGKLDVDVVMSLAQAVGGKYWGRRWLEDIEKYLDDSELTDKEWYDIEDFAGYPKAMTCMGLTPVLGMPIESESQIIIYRNDVYGRLDLEIPNTWDDLVHNAKIITETYGKNTPKPPYEKDIYGSCVRGNETPDMHISPNIDSNLSKEFEDRWFLDNWGIIPYYHPETLDVYANAFDTVATLGETYGPPGYPDYGWKKVTRTVKEGIAAQAHICLAGLPTILRSDYGPMGKDVLRACPVPRGEYGRASNNWTWTLAIPHWAKHPKAGWLFIEWATSKPTVYRLAKLGNWNERKSVLETGIYGEIYPEDWVKAAMIGYEVGLPEYEAHPWAFDIIDRWNTLTLGKIAEGQMTPREGAEWCAMKMQETVEEWWAENPDWREIVGEAPNFLLDLPPDPLETKSWPHDYIESEALLKEITEKPY